MATALLGRSELLILDEPEASLDVASRLEIMDLVERLAAGGVPVLFSTHVADVAVRYADRIAVLNRKILAVGSVEELVAKFGGRGGRWWWGLRDSQRAKSGMGVST